MKWGPLWEELRAESSPGKAGLVRRRVRPDSVSDIYLAVESPGGAPLLILRVPPPVTANLSHWPSATGVETSFRPAGDGQVDVCLKLLNPSSADIFGTLVDDIIDTVAKAATASASIRAFVSRFIAWQRFLERAGLMGLNTRAQLGLYGELWFLRGQLLTWLDRDRAVGAWTGPLGANQDFQPEAVGIEIKCTATKLPLRVHIQSERQLDGTGMRALYLCVFTFDVRDGGEHTLPTLVQEVRSTLAEDAMAAQLFDERLLGMGYQDADAEKYDHRTYALRAARLFRVGEGFPRFTEGDVPSGVGEVTYSVFVDACDQFEVNFDTAREEVLNAAAS